MTIAWLAASGDPSVRSYRDLLNSLRSSLAQRGLGQRPVYSGSQRFDLDEPFDLCSSCPNHNAWVGRAVSAWFEHTSVSSQRSNMRWAGRFDRNTVVPLRRRARDLASDAPPRC